MYDRQNNIHMETIRRYGRRIYNLLEYNCIFDEEAQMLNNKKPHKHKVIEAWQLTLCDNITDGIAFAYYAPNGYLRVVVGCNEKDFDKVGE